MGGMRFQEKVELAIELDFVYIRSLLEKHNSVDVNHLPSLENLTVGCRAHLKRWNCLCILSCRVIPLSWSFIVDTRKILRMEGKQR